MSSTVGVRVAQQQRLHQVGTRERIFPTNPCNLFHTQRVRVYMYTHVLDMQAQSGQLVPQSVSLGLAEPQGLHVLREDRLRHDAVHSGMPQPRQQLSHCGPQAGRGHFADGSILHATHPR